MGDVYHNTSDMESTGWRLVTKRRGYNRIPWDDVVAVGIALSPNYWECVNGGFRYYGGRLGYYRGVLQLLLGKAPSADLIYDGSIRKTLKAA